MGKGGVFITELPVDIIITEKIGRFHLQHNSDGKIQIFHNYLNQWGRLNSLDGLVRGCPFQKLHHKANCNQDGNETAKRDSDITGTGIHNLDL
jgi:hypothetical protein